jgi:hypothetical protein
MICLKISLWSGAFLGALVMGIGNAHAADIGGTISTTLTITEDSQLVDDVTCTVTGAPCIAIAGPNVTLELNGFTMTGQADARTACDGGPSTFNPSAEETAIAVYTQMGVAIRGPGLIRQFRGAGMFLNNSVGVTVKDVTLSTNCRAGVLVGGGSDDDISGNISVRNGNATFPCGGI